MLSVDEMGWSKDIENKPNLVGQSLSRGIMVCGDVTDTPESVIEDYYYFTQHFTAGDMLDEGNLLNHVWLLALRGKRDFATFINTIKAKPVGIKGEVISDKEEYALTKLTESYLQILPTFPGMYSPVE